MRVRRAVQRMLALLRAPRLDRELNDEITAHLEMAERDAVAAGLSPDEARRQARRRFGPVQAMREAHREDRSARWLEILLKDVRYAAGSLCRDPTFAVVAVGVLALGIGANAAMFSVVDAVLLKPLPFPDPDRIVRVWEAPRAGATNATSAPDFDDWSRLATSFDAVTAEQWVSAGADGRRRTMAAEEQGRDRRLFQRIRRHAAARPQLYTRRRSAWRRSRRCPQPHGMADLLRR